MDTWRSNLKWEWLGILCISSILQYCFRSSNRLLSCRSSDPSQPFSVLFGLVWPRCWYRHMQTWVCRAAYAYHSQWQPHRNKSCFRVPFSQLLVLLSSDIPSHESHLSNIANWWYTRSASPQQSVVLSHGQYMCLSFTPPSPTNDAWPRSNCRLRLREVGVDVPYACCVPSRAVGNASAPTFVGSRIKCHKRF